MQSMQDVLSIPQARHLITSVRWDRFVKSGQKLQISEHVNPGSFDETIAHNVEGITNSLNSLPSLERSELVFRPVMAIDRVYRYAERRVYPNLSMLLIGSRTEYEVFCALGYGVEPANLKAVDLISYSPWITPGDMHALPYQENSFDIIIMGWVLAYSSTPRVVAQEIVRVAKKNCVISIGNDCYSEDSNNKLYKFRSSDRPMTMQALVECFAPNVGEIYFGHEPNYPRHDLEGFTGHLIATFSVNK